MPTANIDLPDGTRVRIEGSPEEIARVLTLYGQSRSSTAAIEDGPITAVAVSRPVGRAQGSRTNGGGAMQRLRALIEEQFFTERRSISDVQHRLEVLGHIYPLTHLSTPLRRMVVNKELRRLRSGRNWVYVS